MNRQDATTPVDWTAGEVEAQPREKRDVYSVRPGPELARWLEAEATRRGTNPNALIKILIAEARDAAPAAEDETVTVRLSDLRHAVTTAIDRAARRPAA